MLGDQLTRQVGPLCGADPEETHVLMIESEALASALPNHKQKLVLFFSAMRHYARSLEADGFTVSYYRTESFERGISEHLRANPDAVLQVMEPTDWGVSETLREAAESAGGSLEILENELWLSSKAEFDEWAEGRKALRLEYFYREQRRRLGWLMEGDEPLGGRWNFDAENRQTPDADHAFPPPPRFEPDDLTRGVMREVQAAYPQHFGDVEGFAWPVTREDALVALERFLTERLPLFGPYEDAIVEGEPVLYHSLLSAALNLGLLHPREVCERALEHAARLESDVPLQSIEGFIRQVAGWREFMRHVYRRLMPGLRSANGLQHVVPLPELYWGAETRMRCLGQTIEQLRRTGHAHHIQRLMVLGNFALLAGVDPRALNDWFLACFVDALDWVVTPNVMGMSQFADLGSFTSKPYAASGKYLKRMGNHCAGCVYDVDDVAGNGACPLNSLYWDFLDRHAERLADNPRMRLVLANWERRSDADRAAIRARAETVRAALADGTL